MFCEGRISFREICHEQGCDDDPQEYQTKEEAFEAVRHHVNTDHPLNNISDVHERSLLNSTALHRAAMIGMKERCEELLMREARVDEYDDECYTALIFAAMDGHTDTCQLLLDYGADIEHRTSDGDTALDVAAENGFIDTCKLLISRGATVDTEDHMNFTPLMRAASSGYTDVCQLLLDHGADVEHKSCEGETALDLAAILGLLDVSKLLLSRGADGDNHLMKSLSEKNFKTAHCFIENGVSLDWIEDPRRQFATRIAVEYLSRFDIVY